MTNEWRDYWMIQVEQDDVISYGDWMKKLLNDTSWTNSIGWTHAQWMIQWWMSKWVRE